MSEPNNTFPFPGMEAGGTLDISAIFGSGTPGGDLNPFGMPAAKGPVEQVLRRELGGLDDEFSTLKFLAQELQMRARNLRIKRAA